MYQSNYGYYNPQSQIRQTVAPQLTQPIMQQQPILKGHPVASLEEARATSIDFDGSVFFFPDLANKKIYTKQINADGTASLNMYSKQELPPEMPTSGNYVTHEELETIISQLRQSLTPIAKETAPPLEKSSIKF